MNLLIRLCFMQLFASHLNHIGVKFPTTLLNTTKSADPQQPYSIKIKRGSTLQ